MVYFSDFFLTNIILYNSEARKNKKKLLTQTCSAISTEPESWVTGASIRTSSIYTILAALMSPLSTFINIYYGFKCRCNFIKTVSTIVLAKLKNNSEARKKKKKLLTQTCSAISTEPESWVTGASIRTSSIYTILAALMSPLSTFINIYGFKCH